MTATLVLVLLAVAGWWLVRAAGRGPAGALGAGIIVGLPPWLVHGVRQDRQLMRVAGARPPRVMAIEYVALATPGAVLVVTGALGGRAPWSAAAALVPLVSALACAHTPPGMVGPRRARRTARRRAPARGVGSLGPRFELRRGLRTEGVAVALIVVVASALSAVPVVPALATLAIAMTIAQWHGAIDEDWPLVVAPQRGPGAFLRAKVAGALGAFGAAALPLAALTLARTPEAWLAPALAVAAGAVVVAAAVPLKYARYVPGRRAPAVTLVGSVVIGASLLVPPLAGWLLRTWWRGAVRTLAPYVGGRPLGTRPAGPEATVR